MRTGFRVPRATAFAPLVLALALASCERSGEEMGTNTGMGQAPPPIVVHDQTRHLAVDLPTNGAVNRAQWMRIDRFLADAAPGRPDTVRLTIAGDAAPPVIDLVIRHAFAFGYAENKIKVAPPRRMDRNRGMRLELTSRAAIAELPNCPQTTHLNIIDGDNRVASDWGWSSVAALELEVADPHDLVRGQRGGETDSVMSTAAIKRLQTDKLKKLDTSSSTASVTGGSTGGGQ